MSGSALVERELDRREQLGLPRKIVDAAVIVRVATILASNGDQR